MNRLYYGDNLDILRREIRDESVDLIYLDPPFNSKRDYNLLFKTPKGWESDAQIRLRLMLQKDSVSPRT
jgi:DNA modification methylase